MIPLHTTSLTLKRDHTIDKDAGRTGNRTADPKINIEKQSKCKISKGTVARPKAKDRVLRSVKAECKAKHKDHALEGNLKKCGRTQVRCNKTVKETRNQLQYSA